MTKLAVHRLPVIVTTLELIVVVFLSIYLLLSYLYRTLFPLWPSIPFWPYIVEILPYSIFLLFMIFLGALLILLLLQKNGRGITMFILVSTFFVLILVIDIFFHILGDLNSFQVMIEITLIFGHTLLIYFLMHPAAQQEFSTKSFLLSQQFLLF